MEAAELHLRILRLTGAAYTQRFGASKRAWALRETNAGRWMLGSHQGQATV